MNTRAQLQPIQFSVNVTNNANDYSKSNCTKPFVCVNCAGSHSTVDCKKLKETPSKCVFCKCNHPDSYEGCEHYRNLIQESNKNNYNQQRSTLPPTTTYNRTTFKHNIQPKAFPQHKSYANPTRQNTCHVDITSTTLMKFLDKQKLKFFILFELAAILTISFMTFMKLLNCYNFFFRQSFSSSLTSSGLEQRDLIKKKK